MSPRLAVWTSDEKSGEPIAKLGHRRGPGKVSTPLKREFGNPFAIV
jgi:hypothetical protein